MGKGIILGTLKIQGTHLAPQDGMELVQKYFYFLTNKAETLKKETISEKVAKSCSP